MRIARREPTDYRIKQGTAASIAYLNSIIDLVGGFFDRQIMNDVEVDFEEYLNVLNDDQ